MVNTKKSHGKNRDKNARMIIVNNKGIYNQKERKTQVKYVHFML